MYGRTNIFNNSNNNNNSSSNNVFNNNSSNNTFNTGGNLPQLGSYREEGYRPDLISKSLLDAVQQWKSVEPASISCRLGTLHLSPLQLRMEDYYLIRNNQLKTSHQKYLKDLLFKDQFSKGLMETQCYNLPAISSARPIALDQIKQYPNVLGGRTGNTSGPTTNNISSNNIFTSNNNSSSNNAFMRNGNSNNAGNSSSSSNNIFGNRSNTTSGNIFGNSTMGTMGNNMSGSRNIFNNTSNNTGNNIFNNSSNNNGKNTSPNAGNSSSNNIFNRSSNTNTNTGTQNANNTGNNIFNNNTNNSMNNNSNASNNIFSSNRGASNIFNNNNNNNSNNNPFNNNNNGGNNIFANNNSNMTGSRNIFANNNSSNTSNNNIFANNNNNQSNIFRNNNGNNNIFANNNNGNNLFNNNNGNNLFNNGGNNLFNNNGGGNNLFNNNNNNGNYNMFNNGGMFSNTPNNPFNQPMSMSGNPLNDMYIRQLYQSQQIDELMRIIKPVEKEKPQPKPVERLLDDDYDDFNKKPSSYYQEEYHYPKRNDDDVYIKVSIPDYYGVGGSQNKHKSSRSGGGSGMQDNSRESSKFLRTDSNIIGESLATTNNTTTINDPNPFIVKYRLLVQWQQLKNSEQEIEGEFICKHNDFQQIAVSAIRDKHRFVREDAEVKVISVEKKGKVMTKAVYAVTGVLSMRVFNLLEGHNAFYKSLRLEVSRDRENSQVIVEDLRIVNNAGEAVFLGRVNVRYANFMHDFVISTFEIENNVPELDRECYITYFGLPDNLKEKGGNNAQTCRQMMDKFVKKQSNGYCQCVQVKLFPPSWTIRAKNFLARQ